VKLRDTSVGIATGCRAAVRFLAVARVFSSPTLGPTQPPDQWVPVAISPGIKQPGREATAHLSQVPRSRMWELCLHSP
jgi:hypothetical protein